MPKRGFDDSDSSDDDVGKRPKGGFSNSGPPPDDGPSADNQLDQMLGGGAFVPPPAGGGLGPMGGIGLMGGMGGADLAPVPESDPNKPATTPMDFSRLGQNVPSQDFPVPRDMVEYLMTPEHRQILLEESGCEVEWAPEDSNVLMRGSAEQIKKATRLLQRALMHCNWGKSESKVTRCLRPRIVESAVVLLSPMNRLPSGKKTLSQSSSLLSIGKEKKLNDVVIPAPIVSRQHCILELDCDRGSLYAIDCSTNGTFLNGVRLPPKSSGKVLVSHGDELLLQDPANGDQEFGYIINIQELNVREHVKLQAPRRILSQEEAVSMGRDFA
eukprot:TRINITY_DN65063_c0_g1_i1.p1 TRINITY_DN65063_c0_g1~~TRINITY_DN65063_c0_g1_i1.p1  ORF type:complete len:351 (+),score=67.22 TRINITY_DN65063_c0_g1_i1:75-1055(+)